MPRSLLFTVALLAALLLGPHAASFGASERRFSWPVAPPHPIARPFIAPASEYGAGHRGIDIQGAQVVAPADGIVHFAGRVVDRDVLSIDHGGGLISSFEPVSTDLAKGDVVSRGDPLGSVESGHCERLCVHFGVRRDGKYVSPLLFLGGVERAVLLPTREL